VSSRVYGQLSFFPDISSKLYSGNILAKDAVSYLVVFGKFLEPIKSALNGTRSENYVLGHWWRPTWLYFSNP